LTDFGAQPPDEPALHLRITTDLGDKIRCGAWPPGFRIPFEHELSAQYGCSRATVNKAVSVLVAAGLIQRRKRAGSFVARPLIQSAVLQIPDIEAEVEQRGQVYGYSLISRRFRHIDPSSVAEIALCKSGAVLEIRCLHLADGRPLALEDRIINLAVAPETADADFATRPPGGWLLRHEPWTEAEHRIGAVNPDAASAAHLQIKAAVACLILQRWTWRVGDGVTYARQLFPGDYFDLVARFTPGPVKI
jgi:GntR family histidine utilization transcriptional repressor